MLQFSNDKIRRSWQGKKFMPSIVKGVKPVNTAFAKYSLVGDKTTGAVMIKKEYIRRAKGTKPNELWLVLADDPANRNKESIVDVNDITQYLTAPTTPFDAFVKQNDFKLYCIKGRYKGLRDKATKLIAENDYFEFSAYDCFCEPSIFQIFGKDANYADFGVKEDIDRENAPDFCCGNMKFIPFNEQPKIEACCKKYGIDINQFNTICEALDEGLSFGSCGWCS